MCLRNINIEETKRLQKKPGSVICYKVYWVRGNSWASLNGVRENGVHPLYMHEMPWISQPGIVVAIGRKKETVTRRVAMAEQLFGAINYGIHVYPNRTTAVRVKRESMVNEPVVVPVVCKWKNLRAVGTDNSSRRKSMVFTKVEITQETWDRILKDADAKNA